MHLDHFDFLKTRLVTTDLVLFLLLVLKIYLLKARMDRKHPACCVPQTDQCRRAHAKFFAG